MCQIEQTNQLCAKLVKDYPDTEALSVLLSAIVQAKEGQLQHGVEAITAYAAKQPKHYLELSLAAVQLLLSEVSSNLKPHFCL